MARGIHYSEIRLTSLTSQVAHTKMYRLATTQQTSLIQIKNQTNLDVWIKLCGTASTSKIDYLQRFQSIALRLVVDAPWFVPNVLMRTDPQTQTDGEEIRHYLPQCTSKRRNS
jgi:hypothetical protein